MEQISWKASNLIYGETIGEPLPEKNRKTQFDDDKVAQAPRGVAALESDLPDDGGFSTLFRCILQRGQFFRGKKFRVFTVCGLRQHEQNKSLDFAEARMTLLFSHNYYFDMICKC